MLVELPVTMEEFGIASGLGYQFYDQSGKELLATGQALLEIAELSNQDAVSLPSDVQIKILADVSKSSLR